MEYSLWSRGIEQQIIPLCRYVFILLFKPLFFERSLGPDDSCVTLNMQRACIGIVAYSPLGRGFVGGKAVLKSIPKDSMLPMHPRFVGENLEKNKLLYVRVANLAAKHSCTPPQLALAWLLYQGDDIVPIPGTTKIKNLENNVGSLEVKLSLEESKEVCEAVPANEVNGERDYSAFTNYNWESILHQKQISVKKPIRVNHVILFHLLVFAIPVYDIIHM
ncbi:hypothetical protein MKW94_004781 [Papaver nudicaule]|uniref:NADP-dependent oxidoreductase domain-containing protein n=1 Tax=Papaver nudicaule TaxID=74823 RepID=A0AA41V1D1_PAPNU|nr:hypothetical protein [Papaver nudicaule]